MGRRSEPPAADLKQGRENYAAKGADRWFYDLAERFCFVDDAEEKGELAPPVGALHRMFLLQQARGLAEYDNRLWRERVRGCVETVEIPKAWFDTLMSAWGEYVKGDSRPMLADALGASRSDTRRDARTAIETLTRHAHLAARIQEERINALYDDEIISLEEARARVLETGCDEVANLSDKTLERAWNRWGDLIEDLTAEASRDPDADVPPSRVIE